MPLISLDLVQIIGFAFAGLAAGVFSGSLGLGGALLATPLIRFLGVTPYLAIGTTVPVLFPTTLTGAWTYHRSGLVDLRAAGWTAAGGAVGTVAGALSTRQINGHLLMLLTAAILIVLAIRIIPRRSDDEDQGPPKPPPHPLTFVALGVGAGFFSGLLGIGGGFLIVPVFIRVFGMPVKTTLGTSLAVITVITIPNIVAQTFVGNIDWAVALLLAIGVVPGAFIGARLAIRASERTLRYVVPFAVLAVAIAYAYIEIVELFSA